MSTHEMGTSVDGDLNAGRRGGDDGAVPASRVPLREVDGLVADAQAIVARYPQSRSALLPMLHLVQSVEGYVSPAGIEFCAEQLGLTTAEVSAVATFYTMYKRRPVGDYHVGVCTNTLCAIMGGDSIFSTLKEHLGVGHDETTPDGKITLEHLECNAACDYAPVMMVNWEFFDNMTPESARALVDALQAGDEVTPTRGATLCSFRETSRVLAGFYDGRAGEGPSAGPATLAGLRAAEARGERPSRRTSDRPSSGTDATQPTSGAAGSGPGIAEGYGRAGGPSGHDAPLRTSESDPANTDSPDKQGEGSDT
jgi:NADH-quinone oxidoreductase subunit E